MSSVVESTQTEAPTSLWARLARWLGLGEHRVDSADRLPEPYRSKLRFIVQRGRVRGLEVGQIADEVAKAMHDYAIFSSLGESDIGLFGSSIYRREALAFVRTELDRPR